MWSDVELEIEIDEHRWAVVDVLVVPEQPARRSGHPDTWEPAEPDDVSVERVTLHCETGEALELSGAALDAWARAREREIEELALRAEEGPCK